MEFDPLRKLSISVSLRSGTNDYSELARLAAFAGTVAVGAGDNGLGYGFFVASIKKLLAFSKSSASYILHAFSNSSSCAGFIEPKCGYSVPPIYSYCLNSVIYPNALTSELSLSSCLMANFAILLASYILSLTLCRLIIFYNKFNFATKCL